MKKISLQEVTQYVEENIGVFHQKRIERINKLKLNSVLKKKNPYLFKAKYLLTASEIIEVIVAAFMSSNEETIFGDWLEGLAIFINNKVYGGKKSGITNIDLEFNKDDKRYIVNIKSGPNWGNSSQISKMKSDFTTAAKALRTSNSKLNIIAVNGCCYGIDNHPDKGAYFKYCGQQFWEFISGNKDLYKEIIEPLGHKSKENNEKFAESYSRMINKFTSEFIQNFCTKSGDIDWIKLLEYNSGKTYQ
ncbi:MAG: cytosolic protein [Saprospiraceae bacterium]|jgi:hypothetical protein|nr:cytosolic protein [Saprospiraceae bacterium]